MSSSLGPRARKMLRGVGYTMLALVTFVFALQLTFPYDRVKDRIVDKLSEKYDTTIGSVERGIMPGTMTLHDIKLHARPEKPDDVPAALFVKSLEVKVGLLALVSQTAEVEFEILLVGSPNPISGTISLASSGTGIHVRGDKIPAANLPMRDLLGLPVSGPLTFAVDLELPTETSKTGKTSSNWEKAAGAFAFSCPAGCTIGDGKSKLKAKLSNARNQAFAGDGIEFGKLTIQSLVAKVDIKKGALTLTQFDMRSEDGTLKAEFAMKLAPVLDDSEVTGCLRFAGSKSLLEREQRTYTAITATGAPFGPDELYHIRLQGQFRQIARKGVLCGPDSATADPDAPGNSGTPKRPSITIQGDSPLSPDAADGTALPLNPPPPDQVLLAPDAAMPAAATAMPPSEDDPSAQPPPPPPQFSPTDPPPPPPPEEPSVEPEGNIDQPQIQ